MKTKHLPFATIAFVFFAATTVSAAPPTLSADDQAMVDEFNKKGYTLSERMVDERVADFIHKTFNDDHAAFVHEIGAQGFTEASFRQAQREKIIVQAMRSMVTVAAHSQNPAPIPRAYPPAGAEVVASSSCKDFAARLVSAINSKDAEKFEALLHPKCVPLQNDMLDSANSPQNRLKFYAQFTIPEQYDVFVTTISADAELPWADGVLWPVRPTNQVGIRYKDTHGQNAGPTIFVAADGDKWYEVVSTPRP